MLYVMLWIFFPFKDTQTEWKKKIETTTSHVIRSQWVTLFVASTVQIAIADEVNLSSIVWIRLVDTPSHKWIYDQQLPYKSNGNLINWIYCWIFLYYDHNTDTNESTVNLLIVCICVWNCVSKRTFFCWFYFFFLQAKSKKREKYIIIPLH